VVAKPSKLLILFCKSIGNDAQATLLQKHWKPCPSSSAPKALDTLLQLVYRKSQPIRKGNIKEVEE